MATVFDPNYQDPNKQQQTATTASAGGTVGGATGASTPATSSQPKGSGFVNLQSYLNANQGAGGQMGGDLANKAGSMGKDATNALNTDTNNWDRDVGAGTLRISSGELGGIGSGSLSDGQVNHLASVYNGSYSGPTADKWGNYSNDAAGKLTDLGNFTTAASNGATRGAALSQVYGGANNPQYSAGDSRLDNALIGGSADGKRAISGLGNLYSGIQGQFNNAGTAAQSAVTRAMDDSARASQSVKDAVGNATSGLKSDIHNRTVQANADRAKQYQDFIGQNPGYKDYTSAGRNLSDSDEITAGDSARGSALARIAGTANTFIPSGSTPDAAYTFDKARYDGDQQTAAAKAAADQAAAANAQAIQQQAAARDKAAKDAADKQTKGFHGILQSLMGTGIA